MHAMCTCKEEYPVTDILIVGAGPAGLTAAIYGARAGMSVIVFDKNAYGGQTALTSEIDNFPGVKRIEGVDFANNLYEHALSVGVEVRFEEVIGVEPTGDVKRLSTWDKVYEGRTLILAGGATRRHLDVPGEKEFIGKGVSFCATCDAAFFRDRNVAIVGGGDTALGDALFLSNNCKKVYLIHRRDSFRGAKVKQDAVKGRANVEILYNSVVERIEGKDTVQRIGVKGPEGERTLDVDGVFVAVGLTPETKLYKDFLPLDTAGYIQTGEDCATPLKGVWVAGDLRQKPLYQIVTASADGAVAAVAVAEYCNAADEGLDSGVYK